MGNVRQAFVTVPGDAHEAQKRYRVVGQTNTKRMRVFRELPEEELSGGESEDDDEAVVSAGEVHFVGSINKALALELDLSVYRKSNTVKLLDRRGIDRAAKEISAKKLVPKKASSKKLKSGVTAIIEKKQTKIKIDTAIKLDVGDDTQLEKGKMFNFDETMKITFKCFEKYPYMSFQELKDFFGRRASGTMVKSVLRQIADYQRTGDHTGKYGLKASFVSSKKQPSASSSK